MYRVCLHGTPRAARTIALWYAQEVRILRHIHTYDYLMAPIKRINSIADVAQFGESRAYAQILKRIELISLACKGVQYNGTHSSLVTPVLTVLQTLSDLIPKFPPVQSHKRYGNPSYKDWNQEMTECVKKCFFDIPQPNPVLEELQFYLFNAFGSLQRIDYGTGHELNFLAFFDGFLRVREAEADGQDILCVFFTYFELMTTLIRTYNLEPAGSHGVWGLDDHFHIPYIIGAAQCIGSLIEPQDVLNEKKVAEYKSSNLYFAAIAFIYEMKRGRFAEHSPILYDVSSIPTWTKIQQGMRKMYVGEVLTKFPVVQHFYFGTLFSFDPNPEKNYQTF